MKKLLLAVPVMMTLVLVGCEKSLGEHEVKGPNGKIYDRREWTRYYPQYTEKDGSLKCYLVKNATYLRSIGKPVPEAEKEYLYTPAKPGCVIPESDTPVFKCPERNLI